MGKTEREKGKRGERMLVRFLRDLGYECRRTAQYCGKTGDAADVVGLPGLHIECKFVEKLNVRQALKQAAHDAAGGNTPSVCHKTSREEWLITMRLEDFITKFYRESEGEK